MASDDEAPALLTRAPHPAESPQLRSRDLMRQAHAARARHEKVRDEHARAMAQSLAARDISTSTRAAASLAVLRRKAGVYLRWRACGWITSEEARDCMQDDIRTAGLDLHAPAFLHLQALRASGGASPGGPADSGS